MSTIKTTKKFTIATLIALSATSTGAIAANASGWATTPANVKAAQDLTSIAKANYEHHLALINNESIRKDPAKFAEAAAAFEKSRQEYQRVVTIEKEQIAIAIQGGKPTTITAAAPAPTAQQTTSKTPTLVAPELAPVKAPVSTGYREPQNVAKPTIVAPQAAPQATPVSTGYREPQNIAKPEIIAPQASPAKTPTSTGYREPQNVASPVLIAPQATPEKAPVSTGYREPQNVATPAAPKPYAEPQRLATAKPATKTPDLIAPPLAPQAKPTSTGYREPQNIATPAQPAPYAEPARLATAKPESKTPSLISPELAPIATPAKPAENAGAPHLAAHADPVAPTHLLPQAEPTKAPNAPVVPAAPVTPGKLFAHAEPTKLATVIAPALAPSKTPAQLVTPATPEARAPQTIVKAEPLPAHAPVAAEPAALVTPVSGPYQAPVGKEIAGTGYKGEATGRSLASRILTVNGTTVTGDLSGTTGLNQDIAAELRDKLDRQQYVNDHAQDKLDAQATNKTVADLGKLVGTNKTDIATVKTTLGTKVSQADFDADQQKQDDAIKAANNDIRQNGKAIKAVTGSVNAAIDTAADYTDKAVDGALAHTDKALDTAITYTDDAVAAETKDRLATEKLVKANIQHLGNMTTGNTANINKVQDAATAYTDTSVEGALDHADKVGEQAMTYTDDAVTVETTRATTVEKGLKAGITAASKRADDAQDAAVAYTDKAVDGALTHADAVLDTAVKYTDDSVVDLQKGIDTNKANVSTLAGEVAQKESHADFVADQQRQDKALATETTRASTAEAGLTAKTLGNSAAIRKVSTEVQAQGVYVQRQGQVIQQHTTAIEQNRQGVAQNRAGIKRNSDRIDATNKRIDDLKSDNRDVRREMKSIGNNAAAMSSLHFDGNRSSWAISSGSYNADGAAFAGGLQKSIGEHAAVTVQASFDGQGNTMIGAGIHGDFE